MDMPIQMLVLIVLALIAALVIAMLIFNIGGQGENLIGGMTGFFQNLLGFGGK
jgi:hypothetical protein